MVQVDYQKLATILADQSKLSDLASSNNDLLNEISNCVNVISDWYRNMTIEEAIKSIYWQGILVDYGTFGMRTNTVRKYKNHTTSQKFHFNQSLSRGKLLSIDFGTTNIGREFSLTHTGIVISDNSAMVTVIPVTSQENINLNHFSKQLQKCFIPVLKQDYNQIGNDSYALIHQITSVSKNRITRKGIIGSIANTPIMEEIEQKLFEDFSPYVKKLYDEQVNSLSKQNESLITKMLEMQKELDKFVDTKKN